MNADDQAQMYEHTLDRAGVYQMGITPYGAEESTAQREYNVEHLGETARQFEWLKNETEALAAITRGFGHIVENARALDPEASPLAKPKKKEKQRMYYSNKGKKRKVKR